jgi:hypothetical protein
MFMLKILTGTLPWENDRSDDEVLFLFSLNNNKRKRKWVHEVNMERKKFAEFHNLLKLLRKDEVKFIFIIYK